MNEANLFSRLCRTCLVISVENVRSLYQTNVARIMTECFATQFDLNDNLPKIICSGCWNTVESFNKFKLRSRENEEFLRAHLQTNSYDESQWLSLIDNYKLSHAPHPSALIKQENVDMHNNHVADMFIAPLLTTSMVKSDDDDQISVKDEFSPSFYDNKTHLINDRDKIKLKKSLKTKRKQQKKHHELAIKRNKSVVNGDRFNDNPPDVEGMGYSDGFSDGDFSDDSADSWYESDDKKPFSCTKCPEVFPCAKSLQKHNKLTHDKSFACPELECGRNFLELIKLVKHVRIKHKYTKSIACHMCEAMFYMPQQLKRHEMYLHGKKRIKKEMGTFCSICNANFDNLKKHMLIHRREKKECDYCGKKFEKREYMRMHVKRIHECKVCHICGKRYTSSNHLSKHEVSMDGQEYGVVKDVPCPQCGKNFASKRNLLSHVSAVHHAKMATCPICNLSIKKKNLNRHILAIHEQCVKAICTICNAKFKDGYSLKMHMRMHTDERPYPCPYCEKTFRHGGTLKKHIRIHTGERPYACQICNKTFNQSTPLKTHMKTHTGERPYACKLCTKTFSQSCSLTTHMKTHYKL